MQQLTGVSRLAAAVGVGKIIVSRDTYSYLEAIIDNNALIIETIISYYLDKYVLCLQSIENKLSSTLPFKSKIIQTYASFK